MFGPGQIEYWAREKANLDLGPSGGGPDWKTVRIVCAIIIILYTIGALK